jgi:DNA-binding transcriptional regulator YdaS (Cro superfamily)
MEPIKQAIEALGGKQSELADRLDVTPQAVSQWVLGIRPVPAKHCIPIETATGGAVTRYQLRPDVFGAPPSGPTDQQAAA